MALQLMRAEWKKGNGGAEWKKGNGGGLSALRCLVQLNPGNKDMEKAGELGVDSI